MSLSACLIVRDEIASLASCLDSVASIADEIVIVDTGSTDGTLELVQRRATRFARMAWIDDFAAARNASLDLAQCDWILVIDADEQLVGDRDRVRRSIEDPRALAYQLEQRSDLGNGTAGSVFITRLFRRLPELRYVGRVHEHVGDGIAAMMARDPAWQVGRIDGVALAHSGYVPAIAATKGERNARILERELAAAPDDYYLHYKLYQARGGGSAHRELLWRSARLLQAMAEPALRRAGVADEILTGAALAWLDAGELAQAERAARTALVLGRHPATLVVLGRALGTTREARELLLEARARPPAAHEFHVDAPAIDRMASVALIDHYLATGEPAVELARATVQRFGRHADLVHRLVRALLASGDANSALNDGFAWFETHQTDAVCLRLCADAAEALGHMDDAHAWRAAADQIGPR